MAKKESRFKVVHTDGGFAAVTQILLDTETGVNYLWHRDGNAGGLTPLLNPGGSPVVTPKFKIPEE